MKPSIKYDFSDFTIENYRKYIKMAGEKYQFRTYLNFDRQEKFVLWRHDVDFSMVQAVKLAQIENDERVTATYFLHFHNVYYNLFEKEITRHVRQIQSYGHQLGLHFEIDYYQIESIDQLESFIAREKRILEEVFGQEIKVLSFHMPNQKNYGYQQWQFAGLINTLAEYFQNEVEYCSDSNGYWHKHRLEDVLREARFERLQVLTHPVWWCDEVLSPRQRFERTIDARSQWMRKWYENVVQTDGRKEPDWE
jgi:hypothetical protein